MTKRLLVVDDDSEMCSMLEDFLTQDGYQVRKFMNPLDALNGLKDEDADAVITDLNMPEMSGLQVTRAVKEINADIPVLLITAFGTLESAIEAMQAGASDYVIKPFNLKEMKLKLARVFQMQDLKNQNQILRGEIRGQHSFGGIIGKSPAMLEIFDLVRRVSDATANVLINGESGTGKEQVARAIHQNGSRAAHAFVAINCTAIPEALMESELFGHARGSFTGAHARKKGLFEEAEGGTLFLDEIGDMDLSLQSKLLRVLQERKIRAVGDTVDRDVDVRVIAATHKDLKTSIKNGGFREDLYYRLNVIPIVIPPLRHRREDIPLLAESFLKKYAVANNSRVTHFTQRALTKMMAMSWEGNVRELENCIERAVVLCRGHLIDEHDLPATSDVTPDSFFGEVSGRFPTIEEFEKKYIKFILDKTGGKKEKAAQILGMNRRTLYRKEREYGFVSTALHPEKRPLHH